MADLPNAEVLEKPSDLGKSPEAKVRRWKLEIKLADKREANWRKKATDIYKLYTPEQPATNSFNILWTNTETLRQSVYNSLPQPDARRRYQDDDPLGKAVGEVLTRALEFSQDTYDFDGLLKGDVLTMLLPGRAVSRVRYVPDIKSEAKEATGDEEVETYEEIAWEQAICEKVQWDRFRILCAAKTWEEVNAISFEHRFTREDCVEKFGEEIGNEIPLDAVDDEDVKQSKDAGDLFKTAQIYEIWDKDNKEVIFICTNYAKPCKIQSDPLGLQGFFPIPRPLYAIENDTTLVPAALYTQYEQQAKELNEISKRINNIVKALKVRGVYDATLTELSELMKAGDNDLIATSNVTAMIEKGGLDKAIWMMPIKDAAMVVQELYTQRDQTKQIIYEITGISDIMRAASDPAETFGAQKIKTQWGTQRLQRLQREVQRYIRDLIRLKAEIISEKFQPETLEAMTLVELPHQKDVDAQKQQMMAQYQQQAQMAQQQGQQPPPQPQIPEQITWEMVVDALRGDATRTYRIDIETDSTLTATQDSDMEGLQQLLGGLTQFIEGIGPAVQQGAIPIEAVKEIVLAVCRRAKMGSSVEDALSKMKQPDPPPDPNAGQAEIEKAKLEANMQMEQMKMQGQQQMEQFKAELSVQTEQMKQDAQDKQAASQLEMEAQRNQHEAMLAAQVEQQKNEMETQREQAKLEFERWKVQYESKVQILIEEFKAKSAMKQTVATHNASNPEARIELPEEMPNEVPDRAEEQQAMLSQVTQSLSAQIQELVAQSDQKQQALVEALTRPRTATLPNGKQVTIQ